ncbi:MAG: NAD(P)-dependent alcohol dehydrogenase [Hyphomicrobiales bacterium]|nr:NAD(P)-dependent alcohol dehydrogenase [Hyphomicrobiales bacterium]
MTLNVLGWAAPAAKAPMAPWSFERRDPRPDDVVIDIDYCGVCHSDLHNVQNDWGRSTYPMIPGHEIIGRVSAVGSQVTKFAVGDRVGVGCMVDSCFACDPCEDGEEQYCPHCVYTYGHTDPKDGRVTYGGYSEKIVVTERFVLKAPETIDPASVAPLLCAGITTWSPLRHWNVGPGSKVAIVGLGGLGHMGLKLAKALGADVTLFSRSPGKEADARRLGADRVVISTDAGQMAAVVDTFDLIIDTVPYVHDVNPYIPTLTTDGTLVLVGYLGPLEPALDTAPMVFRRKAVAGSLIGGIRDTQEMLDFCGEHGIGADVEVIRMQDIDAAFERLKKADVKYRFVIDMATLRA